MKKKFLLITSLILLVLIGFLFFSPVTFEIKKQIIISAPITSVASQITDLKNWPHWNSELKNKDSSQIKFSRSNSLESISILNNTKYTVIRKSPADVTVKEENDGREIYHSIFTFPDSSSRVTKITWIENLTPLNWIKEKINPSQKIDSNLNNLKNYFEDPVQFYGFDIQMKTVEDSIIITKIATTTQSNKLVMLTKLYKNIIAEATENNISIPQNSPRMANYYGFARGDSVKIMAGIPINKKANAKSNISYLEMPSHGKMLIGVYEGDYDGLKKLYAAMEKYISDKSLHVIALPYEKYLTNPQSPQDSLHMRIQLNYPIL